MEYRKLFYAISISSLFLTAMTLALIGYWTFYPDKIITIENNQSIKLDKSSYKPGDRVIYTIEYCKHRNAPATVMRSLVDGIRINYVPYYNNLQQGCGIVNNADLVIPEFVSEGTYHFEATIEFQVNPIKKQIYTWRSVDFQIIK